MKRTFAVAAVCVALSTPAFATTWYGVDVQGAYCFRSEFNPDEVRSYIRNVIGSPETVKVTRTADNEIMAVTINIVKNKSILVYFSSSEYCDRFVLEMKKQGDLVDPSELK